MRSQFSKRRAGRATAPVALAALVVAMAGGAAPASAAPLPECADTVAPSDLVAGQHAVGHTVRSGDEVEPFDVEILGVLEDAIAPGRDLIIVDTSGPVIDAGGGGISAGMSGSPVYTDDDKLIGAIAYGFSAGPSSIGGVTPAPDMLDVIDQPSAVAATSASSEVRLSRGLRTKVASHERVSASAVPTTMSRLRVPLSISGGLLPERAAIVQRAVDHAGLPLLVTAGGSASATELVPTATVAPGDAFAAALSYGDVTDVATGTTTYVCDGKAVAFGHPFMFGGPTLLGASRASVLAIVDDPTFGPFKLTSVGEPVGIVDQDRLAGIRGLLGEPIPTLPVTQDTTALDTGRTRLGARSDIVQASGQGADFLPFSVATHAFTNIDATFDQISGGSSHLSFTIEGTETDSGEPWSLSRSNRFVSPRDISIASVSELAGFTGILVEQDLAPIRLDSVDIEVSVEQTRRQYEVGKVRWSVAGGPFRDVRRVRARPGQSIVAHVPLRPSDDGARRRVTMRFQVPHRRRDGVITVGGRGRSGLDLFCVLEGGCGTTNARTFDRLLAILHARARNDDLIGEAVFGRSDRETRSRQDKVVKGHDRLKVIVHRHRNRGGGLESTAPALRAR